ncbi:MAG: AmmeMemoRadiSam system protein A [Desulfobacterales bacterium]
MHGETNSTGEFTKKQGRVLVDLARNTIANRLGKTGSSEQPETALSSDAFQRRRGTFVTLKKQGQLRGCIGSLSADESVAEGVRRNAINAAFHDPRFNPLSEDELEQVTVEVSILSEPKSLHYEDANDLVAKLRPNIDGVILRKGYHSATFLPQVWEQLKNPEDFLLHLCRKAGLAGDAWRTSKLEILTYQVEYFEEH